MFSKGILIQFAHKVFHTNLHEADTNKSGVGLTNILEILRRWIVMCVHINKVGDTVV